MSSFYLDILKDRLYVENTNSVTRRAAQTAVYDILVAMSKLIAPILCFTAEEIWSFIPKMADMDERSVIFNEISAVSAHTFSDDFRAKWDRIHAIRDDVNKALELARADKVIGKSLEACVVLTCDGELYDFAESIKDSLAQIFIVSDVKLIKGEGTSVEGAYVEGLGVSVEKAEGEKCERCWMYSKTVGENAEHPTLCKRCADVLNK